jgi:hypothetical protein
VSNEFKSIPVLDENGDEVILYEFRDRAFFGLRVRKRYELCTGEAVKSAGREFVVVATDEKLKRVTDAS